MSANQGQAYVPCCRAKAGLPADPFAAPDARRRRDARVWRISAARADRSRPRSGDFAGIGAVALRELGASANVANRSSGAAVGSRVLRRRGSRPPRGVRIATAVVARRAVFAECSARERRQTLVRAYANRRVGGSSAGAAESRGVAYPLVRRPCPLLVPAASGSQIESAPTATMQQPRRSRVKPTLTLGFGREQQHARVSTYCCLHERPRSHSGDGGSLTVADSI